MSDERARAGQTEELVVPVVEERPVVRRREVVTGGVHVHKEVHLRTEVIDEPILREHVEVERRPVGRQVEGPQSPRQEGDALIIPLVEEELVVERRYMLREELVIRRRTEKVRAPQRVVLRSEEAVVRRTTPEEAKGKTP